jgi:hypothetical protein
LFSVASGSALPCSFGLSRQFNLQRILQQNPIQISPADLKCSEIKSVLEWGGGDRPHGPSHGGAMTEIRVHCYAGYRADERPSRFTIRDKEYEVQELDGRWYSPDATYFRVQANDGNYYVLRHDESQDFWTLDGFRAAHRD